MTAHYEIISPRQDRNGKTRWLKIGAAFPRDKGGFSIVLDALPLPDAEGRVSLLMSEPLPKDGDGQQGGRQQRQEPEQRQFNPPDDDVPF